MSPTLFMTTCDIYRLNPPSGSPVATNVTVFISEIYQCGSYQTTPLLKPFTHVAEFDPTIDVRDSYPGQAGAWLLGNADTVVFPHGGTEHMVVIFVGLYVNPAGDKRKRVYLDRLTPAWPALEA